MDSGSIESRKQPVKKRTLKSPLALAEKLVPWLGNRHEWLNMMLLFIVLEVTVFSLERARWITPQPSLTVILVLAVLTVWFLVRSRIHGAFVHILTVATGILVTLGQAYILMPAYGVSYRVQQIFSALQSSGQVDGVNIIFTVFLCLLTWITGYISTWLILRRQNAWLPVSLCAVIILINLSNLPDDYHYFFGIFIIAVVLLMAHNRIVRGFIVSGHFPGYKKSGWIFYSSLLLLIVFLGGVVAWVTPAGRLPQLETFVATRTLWAQDIGKSAVNPFSKVPAKQAKGTTTTRQSVVFSNKWREGEYIRFVVYADRPSYWRVKTYDTYTSGGWSNSPTQIYLQEQDEPLGGITDPNAITYTVMTNLDSDILLMSGGFVQADIPALLHIGAGGYVVAAKTPRLLRSGESYTITSGVSTTASDRLADAGTDYPDSITSAFLQLPPDFPENIRALSESITQDSVSPYDKVVAINNYLSRFSYKDEIEAPAAGTDGVEHFLYKEKSGYCLYFASAMAVMLRAVDVPSRLVLGYLPGEQGNVAGQYILRDKHYHAWPQAYFPGFGWVDLEVTPRADIAVTVATPWVSDRFEGEWSPWDSWQAWGAHWYLGSVGGPVDTDMLTRPVVSARWPFADVISKIFLAILSAGLLLGVVKFIVWVRWTIFFKGLWHVDRSDYPLGVYERMCALGTLAGLGPGKQQTPLEYAAILAAELPQQASSVYDITQVYMERRFGGSSGRLNLFEEAELLKARCSVFEELLERLTLSNTLLYSWK